MLYLELQNRYYEPQTVVVDKTDFISLFNNHGKSNSVVKFKLSPAFLHSTK